MKTVGAGVTTILSSRQFFLVDLFTFTLVDGTVLYYCAGGADIVYSGNTYKCGVSTNGPFFKREGEGSNIKWGIGLDVDTMNFTILPGSGTVTLATGNGAGIPFAQAITEGIFDYADCLVQRAVVSTWGNVSAGLITIFDGLVGQLQSGRDNAIRITLDSYKDILSINMPRNIYQPGCMNTLYDSACRVNKATFTLTGALVSGSTTSSLNTNSLAPATGYFNLGGIEFTSGVNEGIIAQIQTHTHGSPSTITIIPPLPNVPGATDSFSIWPGCDKRAFTCQNKFSNLVNFRGLPFVPVPEQAF
jgi:uncharacterized phage protein (TIGR02218 family)